MAGYNYPDHFYADAQKSTGAYDARKLYDETSQVAAAQDAKLNPGNDALPSILADLRVIVKRLDAYAEWSRGAVPAAYLTNSERQRAAAGHCEIWKAERDIKKHRVVITPQEANAYLAAFEPNPLCAFISCADDPAHPLHHMTLDVGSGV